MSSGLHATQVGSAETKLDARFGENALTGESAGHVGVCEFGAQASCLTASIVTNVEAGKMPALQLIRTQSFKY